MDVLGYILSEGKERMGPLRVGNEKVVCINWGTTNSIHGSHGRWEANHHNERGGPESDERGSLGGRCSRWTKRQSTCLIRASGMTTTTSNLITPLLASSSVLKKFHPRYLSPIGITVIVGISLSSQASQSQAD
ncbi:hypothetical protein E2542_SST10738 [Spatholobus suberectus]|nr:hypothetical protein E2542_SST10738 [Spatholobus suberectus]